MAEQPIDVDKVVREVLARLGAAPGKRDVATPPRAEAETPPGAVSGEWGGTLTVGAPVVTMAELEGKLGGVKRLMVPARSVVTPSVRDELHRRGIALVCGSGARAEATGAVRLVTAVLGSRFDPGPLLRAIQDEGIEIDQRRADCLIAATDELAGALGRPNTLGLVLSASPAVALCLANRRRGVRAIGADDPAAVDAAAAAVGANVLVVNPAAASVFQLARMVRGFCHGGPRECPEALRERLG